MIKKIGELTFEDGTVRFVELPKKPRFIFSGIEVVFQKDYYSKKEKCILTDVFSDVERRFANKNLPKIEPF